MPVSILDHRGNVLKTVHTDAHDPHRAVEVTTQEIDPILRHVEAQRHARGTTMQGHTDGMVLAGFIPDFAVEQMIRECGHFPDDDMIEAWLNDPQNDCFRVWRGRV